MAKLSVVISAFNEEKNIKDCLESVHKLADEIIVVDNTSTDNTVEIARKYTDKIYSRPNLLMLNINKNYGFEKASGDWILNLDADERVTPELAKEIKATTEQGDSNRIVGYWIPRKNIIFGKWIRHSLWWPDEQLRLFRQRKGKFPEKDIHEYIEVDGKTANLENTITHFNYNSISQFLYKMDKIYAKNQAEVFLKSGKNLNWTDAIRWPVADFLKTFFAQEGYKDGLHGLVLSLLQAFYTEVVFAKVWEKQGFWEAEEKDFFQRIEQELKKVRYEVNYWIWESKLRKTNSLVERIFYRFRRKLT